MSVIRRIHHRHSHARKFSPKWLIHFVINNDKKRTSRTNDVNLIKREYRIGNQNLKLRIILDIFW